MFIQPLIQHLLDTLEAKGFKAVVHFELEGVFEACASKPSLDYSAINQKLHALSIDGELKTEYWKNQWEYVSLFNGQSPLKEAQNLTRAMDVLPRLMSQHGASKVLLSPVVWSGDSGRYVSGSGAIFSVDDSHVHIPNAIQVNVSVENIAGENLFATQGLGECIQHQLLLNSYACCVLFLPEEDAFKRLALREDYGLDAELSSPVVLSGGHRGSIALYKEWGKHNQPMGLEPLFYGADESVLHYAGDWKKTARVEHRLGATSKFYDPYLNMLFILLNVLEGIDKWQSRQPPAAFADKALPMSLFDQQDKQGALSLFKDDNWLEDKVNFYSQGLAETSALLSEKDSLGARLKQMVIDKYEQPVITLS